MSGAREIYREIKKATKYCEKVEAIQKIENIQERAKAFKKMDKEISTNDTNDNEYRKIDECINATYISLGLEGKAINKIQDDNVYNKLKKDLIELCKKVSYDKFYLWMVTDWKDYFDIKENDDIEMSKKIEFYMELKSIVMSVIESTENNKHIKKAKNNYTNSMATFKKLLKEIEDIKRSIIVNDNMARDNVQIDADNLDDKAKSLLDKYRSLIENIDGFNENNYWIKSKGDDEIKIKKIDRYFSINRYAISIELYSKYIELKEQYTEITETQIKKENAEKYKMYESVIISDKPNLESYYGDELDLLQRCRKEYKSNPDIDILECIMRNEKMIEEEKNQYWKNNKSEYEW